jgi:5-methylcytosine-specific restriction endonuclease McrA
MRARRAGLLGFFTSPDVICEHCRKPYPEGTKAGKRFCSVDCQRLAYLQTKALRRVAELGDRICAFCQESVPLELRSDARHCSVLCQQAAWYMENNERLRRAARAWAVENHERVTEHNERRRARMAAVTAEKVDIEALWTRDGGHCWICQGAIDRDLRYPHPFSRSLDHVVPISKGGAHAMGNVALSHLRCNISKKDKLLAHLPGWFGIEGEEEPGAMAPTAA